VWDIRIAAKMYAGILGSVAGFVVTAVVLLVTVAATSKSPSNASEIALAAGFLIMALIGCLLGAFGYSDIAAYTKTSSNQLVGSIWLGSTVLVAIVAILVSFEIIAGIWLPQARTLFMVTASSAALAGIIFHITSFADYTQEQGPRRGLTIPARLHGICAALHLTGPVSRISYPPKVHLEAATWTSMVTIEGAFIVGAGIVIRWVGVQFSHSMTVDNLVIGTGIVLMAVSAIFGVRKASVPPGSTGGQNSARELIIVQTICALLIVMMLLSMR
jgi:hypothetical protein